MPNDLTHRLTVRLTASDHDWLTERGAELGIEAGTYLRMLVRQAREPHRQIPAVWVARASSSADYTPPPGQSVCGVVPMRRAARANGKEWIR